MAKFTRDEIELAINLHFGSKKKCAKALGITESTLSRNLKKLSNAFIQRLQGIGVVLGHLISYNEKHGIKPGFIGDTKGTFPGLNLGEQIELLRNEINRLKKELIGCQHQLEQREEKTKKVNN